MDEKFRHIQIQIHQIYFSNSYKTLIFTLCGKYSYIIELLIIMNIWYKLDIDYAYERPPLP